MRENTSNRDEKRAWLSRTVLSAKLCESLFTSCNRDQKFRRVSVLLAAHLHLWIHFGRGYVQHDPWPSRVARAEINSDFVVILAINLQIYTYETARKQHAAQ
jgi:hypothetical protein